MACAIAVEGTEVESTPVGSSSLSCAIAVEGTEVENTPVGSGSLSCAIAVEGTEVESVPVESGSTSFGLKKLNKDISSRSHSTTRARSVQNFRQSNYSLLKLFFSPWFL